MIGVVSLRQGLEAAAAAGLDGDVRFRGREMAHQELGMKVLNRVREELDEKAKVEQFPTMEGRMMTMVMAPR